MTICSLDTPIFNLKSGKLVYLIKRCNKWQVVTHKHSHQKNYNRKRDNLYMSKYVQSKKVSFSAYTF